MAEGFFRAFYSDQYEVYSAGITPTKINPFAIRVMQEVGIDISKQRSKSYKEYGEVFFDIVITTCDEAQEICPFIPAKEFLHWGFPDPAAARGTEEEVLRVFRETRDMIRDRISQAVKNGEI